MNDLTFRIPTAKNEMYLANGQLGQDALLDLFLKAHSIFPGFGDHTDEKFSDFLSSPLNYCRCAVLCAFSSPGILPGKNTEEAVFFHLLRDIIPLWEKSEEGASIRRGELGKFDRRAFLCGITQAPWRSMADKLGGMNRSDRYEKNFLPSGFNWIDVDWHFPDGVIASVLGVSRQAVSYKRNQFIRKMDVSRSLCGNEKEAVTNRHIRLMRCMSIAEFTGIAPEMMDALASVPLPLAREALSMFPDASPERQKEFAQNVSCMFKSDGIPFDQKYFRTLEWMGIEKGMTDSEIARLLLAAFPNALEMSDAALEESAGLAQGTVAALRERSDWAAAFSAIPNVREPIPSLDPLLGMEDCKGVSREEAARLLCVGWNRTDTACQPPVMRAEIQEIPAGNDEIPSQ